MKGERKKGLVKISEIIARGLFTGNIPAIPGTFGSLVGVVIWFYVTDFFLYWAIFLLIWVVSIPGVREVIEQSGSKDPSAVVVDEILGFLFAAGFFERSLQSALSLFILFRIFDIVKPWPASWANREEGLICIFLDDLAAGFYTALAHYLIVVKILFPAGG